MAQRSDHRKPAWLLIGLAKLYYPRPVGALFPGRNLEPPVMGQALKLSPQEQLVAALGFLTLNPPSSASR